AVVRVLSTTLQCDPTLRKETASAIIRTSGESQAPPFRAGSLTIASDNQETYGVIFDFAS
ncbi:MAG: hypothetical protein M1493_06245, partial [Firmicutes bacterium]|nr:hypothetical protein [Bacillota bacterium]